MKAINLGIAFLLELAMLAALAVWGFQVSDNLPLRIVVGVGAPLLAAVLWGIFMAPLSKRRLTGAAYLVLKFVLFGLAAIALAAAGHGTLAVVFAVVAVINQVLLIVWKQETVQPTATS